MNSEQLQNHLEQASQAARVEPTAVSLLVESMACYLDVVARSVSAASEPASDLWGTSMSLLLLSNAANELEAGENRDAVDYLIGMGFEQSGELLARLLVTSEQFIVKPIENDYWYRLILSLLHYLAGGFRVQAFSVIQNMKGLVGKVENNFRDEYWQSFNALRSLSSGRTIRYPANDWERLIFGEELPEGVLSNRIYTLVRRIQQRRRTTLAALGEGDEENWLGNRGIGDQNTVDFWKKYLSNLDDRGITSFTDEQIGPYPGFDAWLQPNKDLLVVLPTGAGKTIIGELKTAITLATGKQAIWILPTRSLVRQTKRELTKSFRNLGVTVEELPTTEDFLPLHSDSPTSAGYIAVSTPEKLAALIRTIPEAVSDVGLVVLDEAQNLFNENRGATFEFVIQSLYENLPECDFVFMTAMADAARRLRSFIRRLKPDNPLDELISENRPTRRLNGVLTVTEKNHPIVLCYPPGLQSEEGNTTRPHRISFNQVKLPAASNALAISLKVLKPLTESTLRTVLFVERKDSTVSQARSIAKAAKSNRVTLPDEDIDRLRTELGRDSIVAQLGTKGVSPHHAGLAPVEQHIVEKWTRDGWLKTVVATPTLAQGVNLPFDISVVCSLQRYSAQSGRREDIPQSEILNMLGRAGRAGYVSDGICLIAVPGGGDTPVHVLDRQRRYYFHKQEASSEFLGLSRLMITAKNSHIDEPAWLYELGNMSISEAQALVAFSLRTVIGEENIRELLSNRLRAFPSIQDLREYFGEARDILDILAGTLEPLVVNLREEFGGDVELMDATMRTGMPVQVLKRYFHVIREDYDLSEKDTSERLDWADQVILGALTECEDREWYKKLFDNDRLELPRVFGAIKQWRLGIPLADIERNWRYRKNETANQIAIGEFFNHKISLIAQFWGALSICEEIRFPSIGGRSPLENIQTYVREGISSVTELEWLNRIGGIDRVLAHTLAQITPDDMDYQELRDYIRRQLDTWQKNRNAIPQEVRGEKLGAIVSILNE